jgi:hypothetical protein
MHIAHLLSLDRPSDIAKALPNLPRGLEKTYDEIFERIMSQEEGLRDIALRTFHWMLSQDGTSDLEQLLVAVCQDPDSDEICPVGLDPDVVLKACQNLLVEEGRYDSTYESRDIRTGMISAELASRLSRLGILVNQDAIRSEGSIESMESLPASELGSKLSDENPERAIQQAGNVSHQVMLGFLTEIILGKHGNETRSYNLVSTFSFLIDVPPESRFWVVMALVQVWLTPPCCQGTLCRATLFLILVGMSARVLVA